MKFLPESGDIPEKLIKSVRKGMATFLSGAGVSMCSKLPNFKLLTCKVYAQLGGGITPDDAEQQAIENGEYDRVFGLLENRIPEALKFKIREIVTNILKYERGMDISAHKSLLKLSQNSRGEVRLLTTNFDTNFEHAAKSLKIDCKSHAFNSIPKAGGANDSGIIHVHGRIGDSRVNVEESDLILSSPEFGDAYLRSNILSRYFEERLRIGPLILVGYGAEDSALRLLFESLNADRTRFPDLHDIYVLDKVKHDADALKAATANWKLKGAKLIGFSDYPFIYDTLAEWAEYNADPAHYSLSKIC